MESKKHRELAEKIAKQLGTEYHGDKGIDIRTARQAIEVEVKPEAFGHARKQLAGTTKAPYVLVPKDLVKQALESMRGTRFGVMDEQANIVKRGIRK